MRYKIVLALFFILNFTWLSSQDNSQNPQIDKIDILHYDFDIKVTDENDKIFVKSKVTLLFKEKVKSFYLDLKTKENKKGMLVYSVKQEGLSLSFDHKDDRLFIYNDNWDKGDTVSIDIVYSGVPADGLVISKNNFGDRTFFGDNWPNRAHYWLSVIDHLSDKASVDFVVKSPKHYEVIANGELLEKKNIDNGYQYHHFSTKGIPIPPKVMVIGLADFDIKSYGDVYGIPVSSMVFHPAPTRGLDDYLPAMDILKYYIDSIGPYSYLKLANVQSKTRYGGMENAGNIFYYEASINGRNQVEALVAHEIAHQWFGNSTTESNWFDIWLSEGFATYLTDMYLEHKYGKEKLKERMSKERKKVIKYNSRISKPVIDTTVTDWNRLLNPNSYEKGAWFLHMLRNKIGNVNFSKLLREYYKKYRNSNASTKDFRRVAEEISGLKLKSFFDQWLRSEGHPNLKVKWKIDNNKVFVKVSQLGNKFILDLPVRITSNNRETYDFNIKVTCNDDIYVFPIENSFSSSNSKLDLDPNVILLYEAEVLNDQSLLLKTPIIENGSLLQEGDLLFQDLDCGPLCEAIESVTQGINRAHFSHVAIVYKKTKDKVILIEAIGSEVKYIDLNDFLKRSYDDYGRPKVVVGRLKDRNIIKKAIINLDNYIGKPYDDAFDMENDSYYCSELVYFAFQNEKGENIFSMNPMTYKDKESGKFFQPWVEYFKKLNKDVPEGQPGINPGGISRDKNVDILYKYGNPEGW